MESFKDIHADFANFGGYFSTKLEPQLKTIEQQRLAKLASFKKWRLWVIVGSVGLAVLVTILAHEWMPGVFAGLAAGGTGLAVAFGPLDKLRKQAHLDILPQIAKELGMKMTVTEFLPPHREVFEEYSLMPKIYQRSNFEDLITGKRQGADFTLYEAHLEKRTKSKNGDSWKTVFHGQLFRIDYHKEFMGETVIMRDAGFMNHFTKPAKGFQKVGLASPRFEKAFEAWSTDQVEARDLLDPLVLERFLELEHLYEGKNLRAAWAKGCLYIAMETGDRMQMGSVFEPVDGRERISTILKEFASIYDLVDIIAKPVSGRSTDVFSVRDIRD